MPLHNSHPNHIKMYGTWLGAICLSKKYFPEIVGERNTCFSCESIPCGWLLSGCTHCVIQIWRSHHVRPSGMEDFLLEISEMIETWLVMVPA